MTNKIEIIFSCDDNYIPFLGVALASLEKHGNKRNTYNIRILSANNINESNKEKILNSFNKDNYHIVFIDVSSYVKEHDCDLFVRDYYTKTTYYRLFIPTLFPELDKVLYLDSDIVVMDDVAKLYNYPLGLNLVGAIPEKVMSTYDVFGEYVERALGIDREYFFNAGVLLMNTRRFREENLLEQFLDLNKRYTFYVTQDEDYLNVLCKDRVAYMNEVWNKSPIGNDLLPNKSLKIVHFLLNWKPWKYDSINYGNLFWEFAYNSPFFNELLQIKLNNNNLETKEKDDKALLNLMEYAKKEAEDSDNYLNQQLRLGLESKYE